MYNQKNYLQIWELAPEYHYKNYSITYNKNESSYLTPAGYDDNILVSHTINSIAKMKQGGSDADHIDEILKSRKHLIRSKIELILLQLGQRKTINRKMIQGINNDLCMAQTMLMEMGYDTRGMDWNRLALEKIKFDLERQIRQEQANYFQDTGMLNRDLRDSLIQYVDQIQKDSLINGMEVEK